ncbi:uncharacterized protein LOC111906874 [Lactuca sativa]|uniref:uncharacterized protein LOC111906874 n=1 Tax=Lactuca sativa TaxID=4236 RepID=UPI000CD9CBA3|nr:uncharacterized protein LOC111906874 [Lactuca sativa]
MYFEVDFDGNNEPLLLAIGLGTLECEESWRWFIMKLKECLGEDIDDGFISNLCDKIDFVVQSVYPDSYHRYCPKDIARKIRNFVGHNDTEVEMLFWKSCNAYSVHDFYLCLERLQSSYRKPPFYTLLRSLIIWLDDIAISKWTQAFFPKVRYDVKSIDVPEMLQIISKSTREFPITTIIELINTSIQSKYVERAEVAVLQGGCLVGVTPYVENKVKKRVNESYNWVAKCLYEDTFEVDDNFATNKVQFERRVCSCGKLQKSSIPCGHAIASLRTRTSETIHVMVDYKFTAFVYRVAFGSESVNSIPSHVHWEIPNERVVLHETKMIQHELLAGPVENCPLQLQSKLEPKRPPIRCSIYVVQV